MPPVEEEEDEPIFRDLDLTPPAISIHLARLSKEEQLALAVKASMETIREERAAWVTSFIHDRAAAGILPSETSGVAGIVEEATEVLAPILETSTIVAGVEVPILPQSL